MISPKDLIFLSAQKGLEILNENGQMPSGHNGPYFDEETPVRNNAHWAVISQSISCPEMKIIY